MRVFVYGTLKSGYGNNRILQGHTLVGIRVVEGYKLYNAGFPVAAPEEGSRVIGELWDIGENQLTLQSLDRLEGNGFMYNRTPITTTEGDEGEMYVGGDRAWRFDEMVECPLTDNGEFEWSREARR